MISDTKFVSFLMPYMASKPMLDMAKSYDAMSGIIWPCLASFFDAINGVMTSQTLYLQTLTQLRQTRLHNNINRLYELRHCASALMPLLHGRRIEHFIINADN